MAEAAALPPYEQLVRTFKDVLGRAMYEGGLPPTGSPFDPVTIQAVGHIAYAIRDGRPTDELVTKACHAFANYAAQVDAAQQAEPLTT
jgi:hypothetical protein